MISRSHGFWRNPFALGVLILFLCGVLKLWIPIWRAHSAIVVADPYTYVSYAKNLAHGRFTIHDALSTLVREQKDLWAEKDGPGKMGPVWNTAIRSDGHMIYTVEMAYPLFLSVLIRLGGISLAVASNFLLWPILLGSIFFLLWRGMGRGQEGMIAAATACLLVPVFDYATFLQMHFPWREPFFMSLLAGSLLLMLLYHQKGGRKRLILASALLGLACAAKIANAVYLPVAGIFVLTASSFRKDRRKLPLLLCCVVFFFLGLAPFFVQNILSSGHPLQSLQVIRETREFSITEAGHGLSLGNVKETLRRYRELVYPHAFLLRWPFLLLLLLPLWMQRRRPVTWLIAGLLTAHLALYLQWGNADARHMIFATVLYCSLLGMAVASLCSRWKPLGIVAGLLVGLIPFSPGTHIRIAPEKFTLSNARQLARDLQHQVKEPAIVFSNRQLRDALGVYSKLDVLAFHELLALGDSDYAAPRLRKLMAEHGHLYFLDNEDRDPKHWPSRRSGRIVDFTQADEAFLREHFALHPVASFSRKKYSFDFFDMRPELRLYEIQPWTNTFLKTMLKTPEGGSAFLFLDGRAATEDLAVHWDHKPLDIAENGRRYYQPLLTTNREVEIEVHSDAPFPPLHDMRLVGWDERIHIDIGYDAKHFDLGFFDPPRKDMYPISSRHFEGDVEMILPVRSLANSFTVLTLGIEQKPEEGVPEIEGGKGALSIELPDGTQHPLWEAKGMYYYAVPKASDEPFAGYTRIKIPARPRHIVKCRDVYSSTAWRSRSIPVEGAHGLVYSGRLFPDTEGIPEGGRIPEFAYILKAGTNIVLSGESHGDPLDRNNILSSFQPVSSALNGEWTVQMQGAALMDFQYIRLGDRLNFRWVGPVQGCAVKGFHSPERDRAGKWLAWTESRAVLMVPVSPGAQAYSLSVQIRDSSPLPTRTLKFRFNGHEEWVTLQDNHEVTTLHWVFPAGTPVQTPDCMELVLECDTWNPAKAGHSTDSRDLGIQLYQLDWAPRYKMAQ